MYSTILATLLVTAAASPAMLAPRQSASPTPVAASGGGWPGVATFNNYGSAEVAGQQPQQGQNCPSRQLTQGAQFIAAAGDLSPNISGGKCPATQFTCQNGSPLGPNGSAYNGPSCPTGACGKCYKVTNNGGFNQDMTGVGKSIKVTIVDACPSNSGQNVCKSDPDPRDKCASSENALDIDLPAYQALTGRPYVSGSTPNLNVSIEPC